MRSLLRTWTILVWGALLITSLPTLAQSQNTPEGWVAAERATPGEDAWLHGASLSTLQVRALSLPEALLPSYHKNLQKSLADQGFALLSMGEEKTVEGGGLAILYVWEIELDGQKFTTLVVDLSLGGKQWQLTATGLLDDKYTQQQLERDVLAFAAQL